MANTSTEINNTYGKYGFDSEEKLTSTYDQLKQGVLADASVDLDTDLSDKTKVLLNKFGAGTKLYSEDNTPIVP